MFYLPRQNFSSVSKHMPSNLPILGGWEIRCGEKQRERERERERERINDNLRNIFTISKQNRIPIYSLVV
jgi:hypothetical protein